MHAATVLEKAFKHAHDRGGRATPEQITLTTRHCLSSDQIPDGQPDERVKEPLTQNFYTENRQRLLSTLTWERDYDLEQDTGMGERSYNFWSQSVTKTEADPQ